MIASGEPRAQGEPLRIVVNGDTGVFWTRDKEAVLIAKGIHRIQLQHENAILRQQLDVYKSMSQNCEEKSSKYEDLINNERQQSVMLQERNSKLEEELRSTYTHISRSRNTSNRMKAVAFIVGVALGVVATR